MRTKKISVKLMKQTWKLSRANVHIWIKKHAERGWGIKTACKKEGFIFTGYKTIDSLKVAKDVVKLLTEAIIFIEKNHD